MKMLLITVQTKNEKWNEFAVEIYKKKLGHFITFEHTEVKSKNFSRNQQQEKILFEQEKILKILKPNDFIVVLDEGGAEFNSQAFSEKLKTIMESGFSRIVFVIGGAFGLGPKVKAQSKLQVSLSRLTMSHLVAQVVFLEQIYRAFTIQKGLPYHNS